MTNNSISSRPTATCISAPGFLHHNHFTSPSVTLFNRCIPILCAFLSQFRLTIAGTRRHSNCSHDRMYFLLFTPSSGFHLFGSLLQIFIFITLSLVWLVFTPSWTKTNVGITNSLLLAAIYEWFFSNYTRHLAGQFKKNIKFLNATTV